MNPISKAGLSTALTLMLALASSNVVGAPLANAPADAGVINEQQILFWLMKRGELAADATEAEQQDAIKAYTQHARATKGSRLEIETEKKRLLKAELAKSSKLLGQRSTPATDAAVNKTVKVLAVLVDFPDLPYNNNRLTAGDTDMYYPNYSVDHYRDLLFSTTGLTGPQGQNLQSGYQYFQAVSGQTFFFTGDVKGWVTAANNADYYGANDPLGDDGDLRVDELVKEAVTSAVAGMSATELATYDVEDPYDLNGNGNTDESDGIIDHIMLFHSSIGEEAGGGVLGQDAIWSHRFFVDQSTRGYAIPGTSMKAFGYTVQPIDAAAGVCVHEFGHDLGLPDEYDTNTSNEDGSPVGLWSLMSGGSWVGSLAGTQPSGFSPYARSYLQQKYKGNWINEQDVSLADITNTPTDVNLSAATNHQFGAVNQLSVALPSASIPFKAPFAGQYQYYSNQGDLMNNALYFTIDLPDATSLTLSMMAHWQIEQDYDFMQIKVDGVPIPGNYTKDVGSYYGATHIITGNSSDNPAATGDDSWVKLVYDLSAYKGRSVDISVSYITDESAVEYGIAIDDLQVTQGTSILKDDGAESANSVSLNGFVRIAAERPGADRRYLVQLRNYQGVDAGLAGHKYEPGMLLWLEDFSNADNNVSVHPGYSLIGVIDADQNLIGSSGTEVQIRDAAFSMNDQTVYPNDDHLAAVPRFDDTLNYASPSKPQSGMILPKLGLTMEVVAQEADSSSATVRFNLAGDLPLEASINVASTGLTVNLSPVVVGGEPAFSYSWNFGDGTAESSAVSPSHEYATSGTYTVTLTVTDSDNTLVVATQTVTVSVAPMASFSYELSDLTARFASTSTIGSALIRSHLWDFGDGTTSSLDSVNHTFATSGTYNVTLTITDTLGVESSITQSVVVYLAPNAEFTVTESNLTVTVSNLSNGGLGNITYLWDFGDGIGSGFTALEHTYASAGTYTITLTMTDSAGTTSQDSQSISVAAPVTPPTTSPSTSSSSSGGSLGGIMLALLSMLALRRRYV